MKSVKNIDTDNNEFQQALSLIDYTRSSVFLTGKAGTGKSTFLRYITEHTKKKFVVLAPTGIAAVNAGGQTIHSFFHVPMKPILPDDPEFAKGRLRKRMKYTQRVQKMLRELDLIIIDEISMVRADIIDFIDKILRDYCHNPREPFAGKQLLMVGDVFQLEPVVTPDAREILRRAYDGFYFFNARVFKDIPLVPIELRKVYRQTDETFVAMLDRVRAGAPSAADIMAINSRYLPEYTPGEKNSDDLTMTIATRRDIVTAINESRLAQLPGASVTFTADVQGDFPETSYPTERELTVKEGAQVVFIKNDPDRRWVNGSIGRVARLTDRSISVELEDGDTYELEPELWDNVVYGYDEEEKAVTETVKGSFKQFPVKLAWALTIHKSQGLTFNRVHIDLGGGAFTGGQTYVALSRSTSLEGITLASPLRESDISVNRAVVNFARSFNDSQLIYGALESARADKTYAAAAAAFDQGHFSEALESLAEAVKLRNELSNPLLQKVVSRKLYGLLSEKYRALELEGELQRCRSVLANLATEYCHMGAACLNEGWDAEPAIANYDKALRICPGHYEATVGKARALVMAARTDEAIELLAIPALDPDRHEAALELGCIFMSIGDLSNAFNFLGKAQKAAPNEPKVHDALADAYEASGDEDQAEIHRRRAKELRSKK